MAEVELAIGGHRYGLTCADGEEGELLRLGALVDEQVRVARRAVGGLTEARQLLFAALFLADRVPNDASSSAAPETEAAMIGAGAAERIDALAARIEAVCATVAGA